MASGSPVIVLYAGSAATYVCEGGDVQPTYPFLQPITEELLRLVQSSQLPTSSASLGDSNPPQAKQTVAILRKHLFSLLHDSTLFLVLPLSSSTSYMEEWVRLCFHAQVRVRRLVVLSDVVADSFACNRSNCVVLHASLNMVSVSHVEAGCSTRYGNSRVGGVQALCGGESAMSKLAERVPTVAAAMATRNAQKAAKLDDEGNDEEDGKEAEGTIANDFLLNEELGINLSDAKYRDELIRAFGYKAYRAVVVVPQQQHLDVVSRTSGKGKGKGKGFGQRRSRASSSSSMLDNLRRSYPREVREAPGQLEKLLARVVQGGSNAASSLEEGEPCVLAGEALIIPYMRQLFAFIIRRCGGAVWEAVEREQEAKRQQMPSEHAERGNSNDDSTSGAPQHGKERRSFSLIKSSATPVPKYFRKETNNNSDGSHSNSGGSSDEEDEDDDDVWLHLQPTPLPTAPWWLPLLGASVVSRLPDKDLQRAIITEEEARESNGTVVDWKILL